MMCFSNDAVQKSAMQSPYKPLYVLLVFLFENRIYFFLCMCSKHSCSLLTFHKRSLRILLGCSQNRG